MGTALMKLKEMSIVICKVHPDEEEKGASRFTLLGFSSDGLTPSQTYLIM